MQALRTVEKHLGLEKLYVLGTNCVDNGPRQGLDKFLQAASQDPETVLHYEFMQVGPLRPCFLLRRFEPPQALSRGPVYCHCTAGLLPVCYAREQ